MITQNLIRQNKGTLLFLKYRRHAAPDDRATIFDCDEFLPTSTVKAVNFSVQWATGRTSLFVRPLPYWAGGKPSNPPPPPSHILTKFLSWYPWKQTLVKIWLLGDSNPYSQGKELWRKRRIEMQCRSPVPYRLDHGLRQGYGMVVLAMCLRVRWVIHTTMSVRCSTWYTRLSAVEQWMPKPCSPSGALGGKGGSGR